MKRTLALLTLATTIFIFFVGCYTNTTISTTDIIIDNNITIMWIEQGEQMPVWPPPNFIDNNEWIIQYTEFDIAAGCDMAEMIWLENTSFDMAIPIEWSKPNNSRKIAAEDRDHAISVWFEFTIYLTMTENVDSNYAIHMISNGYFILGSVWHDPNENIWVFSLTFSIASTHHGLRVVINGDNGEIVRMW